MLSALAQGIASHPLGYIILNIDPILFRLGPLAVHWYGLAYVLAIAIGLAVILRWARKMGLHEDQIWGLFIWAAIAGLVGGRLYFVIQQPDLVQNYLLNPINIIAVWNGGMAFFGAIFLASLTLFIIGPRYGIDRWLVIDGGALFGAVGQIFGRFGNIVNGDILGYQAGQLVTPPHGLCLNSPCVAYVSDPHVLSWALVYLNPNSFAPQGIPFQPAQIYEILLNLVALALLWPLRLMLPHIKTGVFFAFYVMLYAISQFVVFFFRGTEPITPFLGVDSLKQAQWTAIFFFIGAVALLALARRFGIAWPFSEEKPLPLPLPAGGLNEALNSAWKAQALALQEHPPAPPFVRRQIRPAPVATPNDLADWRQGDSRYGALRNDFSARESSVSARDEA
ncbi:MAG TPA: prolipoprotein diacylglyceryl transferase [Ktedonobacterales bacterium]|jgi:phosphatidylglycerol:prolipoprotein diacylglycerol transferase|nr:prolipoprotein diacylglyceryl transferase [Ktedonobacterales bacterium]